MRFKQFGLLLLLAFGMASSFAGQGMQRPDDLRGVFFHAQNAAIERDEARQGQQVRIQREPRQPQELGLPDTSGYGGQMEGSSNASDYPRRQGRMTAEERRALRRQIDEVGHDLYAPRR
jgi:hypothetical protein